jgi:heat shock protein HslJ
MKSKEIYALVGVLILLAVFVGWRATTETAMESTEDDKQEEARGSATTQNSRPSSSVTKSQASVNPTVITEKPTPTVPTAQSLAGSSFRLTTYNGTALPSDSKYTLTFTETTFNLKLCNNMSSTYYITNNMLKASNVISTLMYCSSPTNIMKIESDASLMLNSGNTTIYRSGSTLILSQAAQGIVMAFEGF